MIKYRPDIDGLRTVAVGSVVAYHCGLARYFPGGFVGVDVFFVISGFLITKIITTDLREGTFSLWSFYDRRIRRVFPALFVMYIFVLAASFYLMMPTETTQIAKNVLSSIFFVSNIYFYAQFDYFDPLSEINAVLHTWSLSVEEQFYVFMPLCLYFMRNLSARTKMLLIWGAATASLAASTWMVGVDKSAAFFLVQYRAWELLTGAIIAMELVPRVTSLRLAHGLSLAGLALIAFSVFRLSTNSPFPGIWALPACLGTALVIHSGVYVPTFGGRLLALPPVRFVGLVSYSWYLWHWPVWVFGQMLIEPKGVGIAVLIGVSFILAVLSWRFVERPFRQAPRSARPELPARPVRTVGVGLAAIAAMAVAALLTAPIADRFWQVPESITRITSYMYNPPEEAKRVGTCFLTGRQNSFALYEKDACLETSPTKRNFLLMGDSHAAQYYPGMIAARPDIQVLQANASGCRPVQGGKGEPRCTDMMKYVVNDFLPQHRVDTIVIAARWQQGDIPGLVKELEKLRPYADRLVVVGPIVEYRHALPRLLANATYRSDMSGVDRERLTTQKTIDAQMREAVKAAGAVYISAYDTVCPQGHCTVFTDSGVPLQFDYGHLTEDGSKLIVSRMANQLFADAPRLGAAK